MNNKKIRNIFIVVFCAFCIFTVIFNFLVGEQISYKESTKNIIAKDATTISQEIIKDVEIKQDFINKLDKIDSVAIIAHTYWRETNSGTLTLELYDGNYLLAVQNYKVSEIRDQHRTYLEFSSPLSDLNGKTLTLKIKSTSEEGEGICLMSYSDNDLGNCYVNDVLQEGSICIATKGQEKVMFGDYYWPIMGILGSLLAVILFVSYKRYCKGKSSIIVIGINAIYKYQFLISQLVSRDFKSKYKRSVLGIFWSFLNPLLMMIVQFLVFSTIFNADTKSYPIYLLSGVICFNFFKEATDMCLISISNNANLIKKVYVPKYIFPIAKTLSSTINLAISLIPLLLLTVVMGIRLNAKVLLIVYFLLCLILFALGIGMFLAAMMVFFRDIRFIWSVLTQVWQYATPIFYTAEIIPDRFKFIVRLNPLYHFIGNLRKCLMDGISPEPSAYLYCLLFASLSLIIGSLVFKKTQDKFTLYL